MSGASWQEVERVLAEILDLPDAERLLRLETLCAGHADLEARVRSLLAAYNSAGSFLEPPVQVSATFGAPIGADIQDKSAVTSNTFEDNRCLTYAGPGPSPCPNLGKPLKDEDREREDVAAFSRNRLAFPQARLVGAIFHTNASPLTNATASWQPRQTADLNSVTVTGKVVDAACYMLHAAAATSASHMECGAACLARGTPLAIAAEDGTLYFPADGNKQLKALLNARVRASGTVVEKHEPMELKMPVGEKNQMVVRLEGGYKQITLRTLAKAPLRGS